MKYKDFINIQVQTDDYKCPWKNKDVSVKIFTNEIKLIQNENKNISKSNIAFFVMLSQFLRWESNLLVSEENQPMNSTELSEVLDISTRTIRNHMSELCKNNLILQISNNKNIYYCVNPKYMYYGKNINIDLLAMFLTEEEIENEYINHRNCKAYKDWREKSLIRDNYTCQCCGSNNLLEVHHIENFSTNIDKRYDIENSITLCKKCHSVTVKNSFHNINGTLNNTKTQLQNFINTKCLELGIKAKTI